jgi:hypothetical protein
VQHNQLTLEECNAEEQRQRWIIDGDGTVKSSVDPNYCLNIGAVQGKKYLEFQLYTPCAPGGNGNGNGVFKFESDGTFRVDWGDYSNCISTCNAGDAACTATGRTDAVESTLSTAVSATETGNEFWRHIY